MNVERGWARSQSSRREQTDGVFRSSAIPLSVEVKGYGHFQTRGCLLRDDIRRCILEGKGVHTLRLYVGVCFHIQFKLDRWIWGIAEREMGVYHISRVSYVNQELR